MKNYINMVLLVVFVAFVSNVQAQSWTSEQQDVWKGVEKYWETLLSNDANAFLSFIDESYKGWSYQAKVPMSKANVAKWIKHDNKNNSTLFYTLSPVSIWVKGEFAFVNYFYSQMEKDKDGKEKPSSGKWTDILMKKNGKWVIIGDHGGRTSKN